ncbi:tetratricopeptide repeat protein [Marinomonas sp. IMCC 4694]|uniref:tetratricopeptide repeat protein n=1 Tax=Marinomonas sp. IMCC 4694 TaxID=2605432 RepID=UPI0011E76EB1|nr:hypothetical protein [Marinomonas sp. IMCC 4694]TYL47303.1 hypothetical protein FXV75_04670 [Marinomonas sp. IMCC 4694]
MRLKMLFFVFLSCLSASCAYQTVSPPGAYVDPSKRLSVAQAHLFLGQWALAKRQLDYLAVADQDQSYWRLLSLYWLSAEQDSEAMLVHQEALRKYPDDDFIWNNYGVLLGKQKRWNEACEAFETARRFGLAKRQSVQINLSRCALRQKDVNLAEIYLKQAKEIADLPLIGLMTELNLVLIQGNTDKARKIVDFIQANTDMATESVYFNEYNCLSWYLSAHETDLTSYSAASLFTCLDGTR